LTPVAIRAGKLLADRLFGGSDVMIDYDKVGHRIIMLHGIDHSHTILFFYIVIPCFVQL